MYPALIHPPDLLVPLLSGHTTDEPVSSLPRTSLHPCSFRERGGKEEREREREAHCTDRLSLPSSFSLWPPHVYDPWMIFSFIEELVIPGLDRCVYSLFPLPSPSPYRSPSTNVNHTQGGLYLSWEHLPLTPILLTPSVTMNVKEDLWAQGPRNKRPSIRPSILLKKPTSGSSPSSIFPHTHFSLHPLSLFSSLLSDPDPFACGHHPTHPSHCSSPSLPHTATIL